jgi:hypothetical protein
MEDLPWPAEHEGLFYDYTWQDSYKDSPKRQVSALTTDTIEEWRKYAHCLFVLHAWSYTATFEPEITNKESKNEQKTIPMPELKLGGDHDLSVYLNDVCIFAHPFDKDSVVGIYSTLKEALNKETNDE